MTTANEITAPHEVRDEAKFASLIEAYQTGASVPAVVVLDYGDWGMYALCGSHRLAAMAEACGDSDISDSLIVVSADDVIAAIEATPESDWTYAHTMALAAAKRATSWSDFDVTVELLRAYLPAAAQAALMDQ